MSFSWVQGKNLAGILGFFLLFIEWTEDEFIGYAGVDWWKNEGGNELVKRIFGGISRL